MKKYKIPQVKLTYVGKLLSDVQITSSEVAADIFRDSYKIGEIEYTEHFKVMYLNRENKVIGIHETSFGGTTCVLVDAKVIFTGALLANAQAIIACHNHPSGNIKPSTADDDVVKKLRDAGNILGIKVFDALIISKDRYFSYSDEERYL